MKSAPGGNGISKGSAAVMLFDGACGFCKYWIERWQARTGERIEYHAYQDAASRYPEIAAPEFERAVQLVESNGRVTSGADAVFRALELSDVRVPWPRGCVWMKIARTAYGFIASHRVFFSFLTRLFFGRNARPASYLIARAVFLRLLGVAYFFAFLSLFFQVRGLVGKRGILPAGEFLENVRAQLGPERYSLLPTLAWLNASDSFLVGMCVAGVAFSVAVMLGFAPAISLIFLWVLYLSLLTISRVFLGYQWDVLLLETGLLAIFLTAPFALRPAWNQERRTERLARWLLLWLLFRLTFESGVVKLASGDQTWRNLTALAYHYQTQPLPIWTSWYANQTPLSVQKVCCGMMLAIELVAPFAVFGPRNVRRAGAGVMIALQGFIASTGNYCFFNLLTGSLCVLLFDDDVWPRSWQQFFRRERSQTKPAWPFWIVAPVAAVSVGLTSLQLKSMLWPGSRWPDSISWLHRKLAPLRSFNSYGLFAVMTTTRPEIIVEGSRDGESWMPYEFKWKPGDLQKRPGVIAPFQPRLDWQMWFAALGTIQENSWFISFLGRMLEGSPDVLQLMGGNRFADGPPRYIRAVVYQYKFTRSEDKTDAWWSREYVGLYCPALYLSERGELKMR